MSNNSDITQLLSGDSRLKTAIPGFNVRPAQLAMAQAVTKAIAEQQVLICEAGTGTGKTFAYLIPAILSRKKVIISTGTKNLQDQLFHRDLPAIRKALAIPAKIVLLKGRANYLCKYRLQQNSVGAQFYAKETLAELQKVVAWASYTTSGDIAELSDIPEQSLVWSQVTSNTENCLSNECPNYQDCYLVKARQQAREADIVVINHHLFFADLALKEDGFGELLPGADCVVLDEAHQLPEIANNFFGNKISSRQILELCRDCQGEILQSAKDDRQGIPLLQRIETQVQQMRLALGRDNNKGVWQDIKYKSQLKDIIAQLLADITAFAEALAVLAVRSKGLTSCWERAMELSKRFQQLTGETPTTQIHWYETFRQAFSIHFTPMVLADEFQQCIKGRRSAWIMTSATLTVGGKFEHFTDQLDMRADQTLQLESPFDFQQQALLYLPKGLCQPNNEHYTEELVHASLPVINASRGRTFLLFTSHKAVQQAAAILAKKINYPLLIQGSMPKQKLIERFCQLGNAVLIGTSSFWEGVDVRGSALSCVIIDKLPFASPADPILKARIKAMQDRGSDPFNNYQLPKAVLAFKQGIGRLIRDVDDRGVLMVGDPRLQNSHYGKVFLDSIPAMPTTNDLSVVCEFFEEINAI